MELNSLDSQTRGHSDSTANSMSNQNSSKVSSMDEDLDAWNPMAEDYANKAFNDYSQPTTEELKNWMPRKGEQKPSDDLMACYRSEDGDVRLFVNGIPPDLTQEGLRGLFSQAGKVCYCKVIPLRDANRVDTFGFVGYNSYREAENAIRRFDGFPIGNNVKLRVSLSKNKKNSSLPESNLMAAIPTGVINEDLDEKGIDWDAELAPDDLKANSIATNDSAVDQKVAIEDNMVAKDDSADVAVDSIVSSENHKTVQEEHNVEVNSNIYTAAKKPFYADQPSLDHASDVKSNVQSNGQDIEASSNIESKTPSSAQKPKTSGDPCTVCGKKVGKTRCSNCKTPYCGKECQRADWPEHKNQCKWKKKKETAKPIKEPYLIDEDELEISDILGFGKDMFNIAPRQHVLPAITIPPENNGQLEDEDYVYHLGYAHPLNPTREPPIITELVSEDEEIIEKPKTPLITELSSEETPIQSTEPDEVDDNAHNSLTQPLMSKISTEECSYNNTYDDKEEIECSMNSSENTQAVDVDTTTVKEQEAASKIPEIRQPTDLDNCDLLYETSSLEECPPSKKKADDKIGYPRYRITDVPLETMNVGSWYDIVVTFASSPTMFWAQLFQEDTLERQTYLFENLGTFYYEPAPKPYVPSPGDLCVALYTKDNSWYRSKVEYINNNGLITVNHIDFGSTEDVDPSRIRRITSELVSVPKQALKCSLYFPTANKGSWSPEAVGEFEALVMDVKCRAEVKEIKDSVFFLDVYDSNGILINEMFTGQKVSNQTASVDEVERQMTQETQYTKVMNSEDSSIPETSEVVQSPSQVEMIQTTSQQSGQMLIEANVSRVSNVNDSNVAQNEEHQNPAVTVPTPKEEIKPSLSLSGFPVDSKFSQVPPSERTQPTEQSITQNITEGNPTEKQENTSTSLGVSAVSQAPQSDQTQAPISAPRIPVLSSPITSQSSGSLSSSSYEIDLSTKNPLPSSQPVHFIHRTEFEGVVSSVVTPREFQVVLTDPALLEQLEELSNQLNSYCATTPFDPSANYDYNDICAVKSNVDKEWYRGRVLFSCHQGNYSIQLMDIDTKETISSQNMRHIPDWFKSIPSRSVMCSLGGITKRAGTTIFGKDAIDKFKLFALNKKFTCREISKFNNIHIVDLLDDSGQPSVARELIDAGFVDAYLKKVRTTTLHTENTDENMNPSIILTCKVAITTAKLPPPGEVFQISPTEYESPGEFYVRLKDNESQQRLEGICTGMNQHYATTNVPIDWQARERQLCAAFFKSSWLRAFVKEINAENVVTIICVDFGNIEVVSTSALRPLAPQFSHIPYCALRCSLANILPTSGNEWSKEAIDFVRIKMPLSSTLNATLVYKGQTILFIDVLLSNNESLCRLMTAKNLAFYKSKRDSQHPVSPPKEPWFGPQKFKKERSPNARPNWNQEKEGYKEERSPRNRPQRSQNRETQPSAREAAILSAQLRFKEPFKAFATHVESPGCFYIQIADYDMAFKLAALHKDMNTHYNSTFYPPLQPVPNQLYAAQFTMEANTWFRGCVERIEDGKAYVYYPDYGNSELVDFSHLRPLDAKFSLLPFTALTSSLGSICVDGEWSQDAIDLFKEKLPLYEEFDVKMVYKKRNCIYLDIVDPQDSRTTLSKILVARNLASWINENRNSGMNKFPTLKPEEYQPNYMPIDARESLANNIAISNSQENNHLTDKNVQEDYNETTGQNFQKDNNETTGKNFQEDNKNYQEISNEITAKNIQKTTNHPPVKKYFLESLPLITVSPDVFHDAMVLDVKTNGVVSLQILTQDLKELVSLGTSLSSHCNDFDHALYSPTARELCLARFNEDKEWYRAVVDEVLTDNQVRVTFLDYGNEDTLSLQDIRRMEEKFLYLPRQAYSGILKGLSSLPKDVLAALKSRLLEKRTFVRVNDNAVEFFDVGPNDKPSNSVNEDVLEVLYPKLQLPKELDMEFAGRATEVNGTGEIWIQYQLESDVITGIMNDVQSFCESTSASPVTSLPSPGELLFAKHSFYGNWYRVKVQDCKSAQSVQVLFVDYGYSEEVSLEKLRRGKPELMRTSSLAVKCYLVRVIQGMPDADDFVKQILDRIFKVKICDKRGEEFGVELEDYDVPNGPLNINDYLIGFGYKA